MILQGQLKIRKTQTVYLICQAEQNGPLDQMLSGSQCKEH